MNLAGVIAIPVVAGMAAGYAVREATASVVAGAAVGGVIMVGGWALLGRLWLASLTGKPW